MHKRIKYSFNFPLINKKKKRNPVLYDQATHVPLSFVIKYLNVLLMVS